MTKQNQATHAAKYRPSLTTAQIIKITNLAISENPITNESIQLIATLSPFLAKIENGALAAAYVPTPRTSSNSLEALGAGTSTVQGTLPTPTAPTKEQRWEASYAQYLANPLSCNAITIMEAKEHMYLNDLMSTEEMAEFETAQFAIYDAELGLTFPQ